MMEPVEKFTGFTALHRACARGQKDKVQLLIQCNKADVRAKVAKRKATPLHVAAQHGRESVVHLLLQKGAHEDIGEKDCEGNTPLHVAALRGNIEILQELCAKKPSGISLNCSNSGGLTPLHYGARKGNADVVDFLLKNGARKDAVDIKGATPFHIAPEYGSTDVMKALMLQVDHTCNDGWTALHYAAAHGHVQAIKWLVSENASLTERVYRNGDTPLHIAARKQSCKAIQALVKEGADVFSTNKKAEMPMSFVDLTRSYKVEEDNVIKAICRGLREIDTEGMDVTPIDKYGAALLHYAAGFATKEDVEWVIQSIKYFIAYAEEKELLDILNKKDMFDRTAMHWVAITGNQNPGVVKALFNNKIKLSTDGNERKPLFIAIDNEHILCDEFLLAASSEKKEEFSASCEHVFAEWASELKQRWVDFPLPRVSKFWGFLTIEELLGDMKPFYVALHFGKLDIAKLMIRYDATVINQKGPKLGWTALHWATLLENTKIVSMLCADVFGKQLLANEKDYSGKTALDYAVQRKYEGIKRELMERQDIRAELSKDYQHLLDVANVYLVPATLITGATFAASFQPPKLENGSSLFLINCFWISNIMSFMFAVTTIFACLTVIPIKRGFMLNSLLLLLYQATILYLFPTSVISAVTAFIVASYQEMPSSNKSDMMGLLYVVALPCAIVLSSFVILSARNVGPLQRKPF